MKEEPPPDLRVTKEELQEICGWIGDNRGPELDGFPNEGQKFAAKIRERGKGWFR